MDLIDAVISGDIGTVRKILADGIDPNLVLDSSRVTALHFAAQSNRIEIAKLLITAGADVYAQTMPDDYTPAEVARIHGNNHLAELLSYYMVGSTGTVN